MDSASFKFVVYGLAVALVANLFASSRWRLAVLLTSSLAFLAMQTTSVAALLPFAGFLVLGYLCLTAITRGWPRSRLIGIVAIIGAFLWVKKYTILPSALFLEHPYLTVGISYIFFRVLHSRIRRSHWMPRPSDGSWSASFEASSRSTSSPCCSTSFTPMRSPT